jgi:hypothetical protein
MAPRAKPLRAPDVPAELQQFTGDVPESDSLVEHVHIDGKGLAGVRCDSMRLDGTRDTP